MGFQWHFPTELHLPVVFSKGLTLSQWIFTGIVKLIFTDMFQWNFACVISGLQYVVLIQIRLPPLSCRGRLHPCGLYIFNILLTIVSILTYYYVSLSLSLSLYIYICIHTCIHICINMYVCIYIYI